MFVYVLKAHPPQVSPGAVLHGQQWEIIYGYVYHLLWNISGCHNIDVI